jgi:hypothetical protein
MRDIVVTTPKNEMKNAAREAEEARRTPGTKYFRRFSRSVPPDLGPGTRIFYVEDGYVRGFAVVERVVTGSMLCSTTGRQWSPGTYAVMAASSWKWIRPLPMTGFRNWKYFTLQYEIVGDWLSPKPTP